MGHIGYNFDNLGFPTEISDLANRLYQEYRENGKMLFVKTRFQPHTGFRLLKFNSSSIINTVIVLFKVKEFDRVDLSQVEVIVKSATAPTLNNFTKSRKSIIKRVFDLNNGAGDFIDFIKPFLWIDGNIKYEDQLLDCELGADSFNPKYNTLVAAKIIGYEVIDQHTIDLQLEGKTKTWHQEVDARKATSFAMITDLVGMLLVISPDGGYKIVGQALERKLNLI